MRICLVNPFFLPRDGGIERRMLSLGREYLHAGHDVSVVCSRLDGGPGREVVEGLEVVRIGSRASIPYHPPGILVAGGGRAVADAVLGCEPDVVDFQYRWSPAYTAGMERVLRSGVASTFTFHNVFGEGGGILRPFSYVNDSFMKLHIAKYDRIACVSGFVRRDLVARGFPAERVQVCHNALDAPADIDRSAHARAPFGLFVGRLVRTKGLEHLLHALAELRDRRGTEFGFVIAGEGPRRDRLARLASRLGLGRVRFAGHVTEDEKWRLLRTCALFVLPSIAESFGLALLEAMSVASPVVASRVGGVPEVVGDAGITVPAGSPPDLARAIGALLDDPDRGRQLGVAAAARASKFTWREASGTMLAIYAEAIDERRSPLSSRRPHLAVASAPAVRAGDARAVGLEPFRSDS